MKIIRKILFPFVVEKYDLENKWWHRLIKVIFMIIMIFSAFGVFYELSIEHKIKKIGYYFKNINTIDLSYQYDKNTEKLIAYNNDNTTYAENIFVFLNSFLLFFIAIYGISITLQFVYYKMILYVVYGKLYLP